MELPTTNESRVVVWFSCGAASACAAFLALQKYGHARTHVVYCNTLASEHEDNARFLLDVERWLEHPIEIISSERYESIEDIFEERHYLAGNIGAPCTVEMKKIPRFGYQQADDIHVFGYTADEVVRITRFKQSNPELYLDWILYDAGFLKQNCLDLVAAAGIALPVMYLLGFKNNNCIGCVKASSAKYWAKIRRYFPAIWKLRCDQSRRFGAKLTRIKNTRIQLDELPEHVPGDEEDEEAIECGPHCGLQENK